MKTKFYLLTMCFAVFLLGCESEEFDLSQPFVAAFEKPSYDYSKISNGQELKLKLSEPAQSNGSVTVKITAENAQYGIDFTTSPEAINGILEIPFLVGQGEVSYTFTNLIFPFDSDDKKVKLEIIAIHYSGQTSIQGNKTTVISFERSLGTAISPATGGPNQGDQSISI